MQVAGPQPLTDLAIPCPQRTAANNSWCWPLSATTGANVLDATTVATAGATGTSELLEAASERTACDCWLFPFTAFPASAGAAEGPDLLRLLSSPLQRVLPERLHLLPMQMFHSPRVHPELNALGTPAKSSANVNRRRRIS